MVGRRSRSLLLLCSLVLICAPLLTWVTPRANQCGFACFGPVAASGNRLVSDLDGWSLSRALSTALVLCGLGLAGAAARDRFVPFASATALTAVLGLVAFSLNDAGVSLAVGPDFQSTVRPSAWLVLPLLAGLIPVALLLGRSDPSLDS